MGATVDGFASNCDHGTLSVGCWGRTTSTRCGGRGPRWLEAVLATGKLFTNLVDGARIASHLVFSLFVLCLLGRLECASESYLFFSVLAAWC